MEKSKKLMLALLAVFLLSGVFSGGWQPFMPFAAIAEAEAEIEPPEYEGYIGVPLPLKIRMENYAEPGWVRNMHWSGIWISGPEGEFTRVAEALSVYSEAEKAEASKLGQKIIRSLYVHRADPMVVSFAESSASYMGGMRGRFAVIGKNYDAADGTELTMEDVFTSKNMLANEIAMNLIRNYPDAPFQGKNVPELAGVVRQMMDAGSVSWTMDPCGATFYFNPHSFVGDPYGKIYTATILFDNNGGYFFQEKYRRAPDAWCMEMEPGIPLKLTLGANIFGTMEVRCGGGGLQIVRGKAAKTIRDGLYDREDDIFTDPDPMRSIRPVFVKLKDGRKYLYVDCNPAVDPSLYKEEYAPGEKPDFAKLENRHELRVYDLSGDEIHRVECESHFTMLASDPTDVDCREWHVMTNAEDFLLKDTEQPFTADSIHCYVGKDGAPKIRV